MKKIKDDEVLDQFFHLREVSLEMAKKLEELKKQVKKILGKASFGASERYTVELKQVSQLRFDSKAFQNERPEIYEQYKKETISERLDVRLKTKE